MTRFDAFRQSKFFEKNGSRRDPDDPPVTPKWCSGWCPEGRSTTATNDPYQNEVVRSGYFLLATPGGSDDWEPTTATAPTTRISPSKWFW